MKSYLFACVHNAGRSQMAAAFFNVVADPAKARAVSAGTSPAERVHPEVVVAMREAGIDLGPLKPQKLSDDLARTANVLVTMGCGDACPVVAADTRVENWPLDDPKGQPPRVVQRIRDEIRARVVELVARDGVALTR
jgi:arsenate reductase